LVQIEVKFAHRLPDNVIVLEAEQY
jgi:hypothetical protein